MQLQRGVKATWWNNIWAQTGAYPPPPSGLLPMMVRVPWQA